MKKFACLLLLISILAVCNSAYSQCCSQGTPMGGAGNLGTLKQKSLQVVSFYKYSQSTSQKENNPYNIDRAEFNFIGSGLSYGITDKLTVELEMGYFINKTQHYVYNGTNFDLRASGMSNGFISFKHRLLKTKKSNWEIVGGIGLKFPFTTTYQSVNNVQLPIDNQSSTRAFGIAPKLLIFKSFPDLDLNIFLIHRTDFNFKNQYDYQYGHGFTTSIFAAKKLNFISCNALGVIQIRHDNHLKDIKSDGEPVNSTGSNVITVAPQFGYTLWKKFFFSLTYDFPIYQQFNTEKLKNKQAFTFSVVANFSKKIEPVNLNSINVGDQVLIDETAVIKVYGNCSMCKDAIEKMLNSIHGISQASWDIESKMLTVTYDKSVISIDQIKENLAAIGYDTDTHRASKKAYKSLHSCCQYERPN